MAATNELARRLAVDISTDNITWVRLLGTTDVNPTDKPTEVDATDYDSAGFTSTEVTLHAWALTVKYNRKSTAGVFDAVQETIRATQFKFGTAARVYVRWYDRNGKPDAKSGLALVDYNRTKSGTGDLEEVTVSFNGDGVLSDISNPGNSTLPAILSALPSGAAVGSVVTIGGQFFTGATLVKFLAVTATVFTVVSDSTIVAVMPAGVAGSAPVQVTTAAGVSNSFAYTRGA